MYLGAAACGDTLLDHKRSPDEGMAWCSYGYDPLGLGKDTAQVEKYREYELIHARWAMLAAAGIIIPEGLQVKTAPLLPCLDHPNCIRIFTDFA